MSISLVFCGTPEFALPSLEKLYEDSRFHIQLVMSQPDRQRGRGRKLQPSPVKAKALELALDVITPEKASSPEVLEKLDQLQPQVGVVVAYGQILSNAFLQTFAKGCVNVHSSLLPRWRGAAPMERAIMAGDVVTGVSLQKVVRKLDAGPVIGETQIPLPMDMGTRELSERLSQMGAELLIEHLEAYVLGQSELREQEDSQVTHAAKIDKSESKIFWDQSAVHIHNLVRALNQGGPFATCGFRQKSLKLHRTWPLDTTHASAQPGEVVAVEPDHFIICCGQGALQIFSLQPESKARMGAADFIRGYKLKKGDRFD